MVKNKIHKTSGFTLIELIIVLAIIIIMGAISFPFFQKYVVNQRLKTAARDIVMDIGNLKALAVSRNANYQIVFTAGADSSYSIQEDGVEIENKKPSYFKDSIAIDAGTPPSFGTGGPIMRVYSRGTVDNGSVTLRNSRGSRVTIFVNVTGRTRLAYDLR